MISNILKERMKVDIRMVGQVERAGRNGEEVHVYKSQIFDVLDHGELEITMPIEGGKVILLPLDLRYEFIFYTESGLYRSVGRIRERYKTENRYMLKIVLKSPLSKFQRREYFRMQCVLDMIYYPLTKEQAFLEHGEDIMENLRDENFVEKRRDGTIVDISGGGVRFISKEQNEEGGYALVVVLLRTGEHEKQYLLPGRILHCVRLETPEIKYENRVEFIISDSKLREEIIRYVFDEERRMRRSNKG